MHFLMLFLPEFNTIWDQVVSHLVTSHLLSLGLYSFCDNFSPVILPATVTNSSSTYLTGVCVCVCVCRGVERKHATSTVFNSIIIARRTFSVCTTSLWLPPNEVRDTYFAQL